MAMLGAQRAWAEWELFSCEDSYEVQWDLSRVIIIAEIFNRLQFVYLNEKMKEYFNRWSTLLEFCFFLTSLRFSYEEGCPIEDPLSQDVFRELAAPLPFSKQHHSKLVCHITKELMDTENPPLVLPNGYVYSTKVLSIIRTADSLVKIPLKTWIE